MSAPLLGAGPALSGAAGIRPALSDFFPEFLYALRTTNLLTLASSTLTDPNSPAESC